MSVWCYNVHRLLYTSTKAPLPILPLLSLHLTSSYPRGVSNPRPQPQHISIGCPSIGAIHTHQYRSSIWLPQQNNLRPCLKSPKLYLRPNQMPCSESVAGSVSRSFARLNEHTSRIRKQLRILHRGTRSSFGRGSCMPITLALLTSNLPIPHLRGVVGASRLGDWLVDGTTWSRLRLRMLAES